MKMGFMSILCLVFLMFFQFSARRIRIMHTFWKRRQSKRSPHMLRREHLYRFYSLTNHRMKLLFSQERLPSSCSTNRVPAFASEYAVCSRSPFAFLPLVTET